MKRKTSKKATKPASVLVLRTCAAGMTAHGGFQWPASGPVTAPDWNPTAECGHGLHGLLWGEGDGALLDWSPDAKWLVVEVAADSVIAIGCKVKFPRGVVVFCGDRKGATDYIAARAPSTIKAIVGGTSTSGDYGTSTSGDYGTSTSGYGGTSTSGYGGTSTSGYGGILNIRWWDGRRYRIATFYVGEDGIEPNQPYQVDGKGKPVKVEKTKEAA